MRPQAHCALPVIRRLPATQSEDSRALDPCLAAACEQWRTAHRPTDGGGGDLPAAARLRQARRPADRVHPPKRDPGVGQGADRRAGAGHGRARPPLVSAIFKAAVGDRLIASSPCIRIALPKQRRRSGYPHRHRGGRAGRCGPRPLPGPHRLRRRDGTAPGGARKDAGLREWATFHDLRHFYASPLIAKGSSVKTVPAPCGPPVRHGDARHLRAPLARQ